MVNKPATAHARSNQPGAPLSRDDSAEVMKMPDPIIEPITIMVGSIGPSSEQDRTRMNARQVETARPRAEEISAGAWGRARLHVRSCSSHSRALRCADCYAFAFQLGSQFTGKLDRAGVSP